MERKDISSTDPNTEHTVWSQEYAAQHTITCVHQRYSLWYPCTQGFHRHTRDWKHSEGHPKWGESKFKLAQTAVTRNSSVNKNAREHAVVCTGPDNSRHACLQPDT